MPDLAQIPTSTASPILSSAGVWGQWNIIYTGTSATSTSEPITCGTANNSLIWSAWNAQYIPTSANQIVTHTITSATTSCTNLIITNLTWTQWNVLHQGTAEERATAMAQAEGRARTYRAEQERVRVERSAAEKRAEKLLQESLNPEQREELASKGFFTLETIRPSGERRLYRIRRGRSRNVEQVDMTGRRIKTLCAHPIASVPDPDTMLAQKLMLESSEDDFLRIAHHS